MVETQTLSPIATEAKVAAKWWADVIRNGAKLDNGDAFQSAFGAAFQDAPPSEQVDAFETALVKVIEEQFSKSAEGALEQGNPLIGSYYRTISVDYHPDRILVEAAEAAGLQYSMTTFPWKTVMWVNPGEVKVAYGYGAQPEVIYTAEAVAA